MRSTHRAFRIALAVGLSLAALAFFLYAPASSWLSARHQRQQLVQFGAAVEVGGDQRRAQLLENARSYNSALLSEEDFDTGAANYSQQLALDETEVLGRIVIDKIGVDLPIYHGTEDSVLRKGAGHVEQSSLPVGGLGTHTAITAHRGLAQSRLFTDLDRVEVGDTFTLQVLGETLVYRVAAVQTVRPDRTDWLDFGPKLDQATLITCDPLGVNSQRILVTGLRVEGSQLPADFSLSAPAAAPDFPWWVAVLVAGAGLVAFRVWRSLRPAAKGATVPSRSE